MQGVPCSIPSRAQNSDYTSAVFTSVSDHLGPQVQWVTKTSVTVLIKVTSDSFTPQPWHRHWRSVLNNLPRDQCVLNNIPDLLTEIYPE